MLQKLVLGLLLGGGILAQQVPSQPTSPYAGMPVLHPESLSGLWEASDNRGGAVGIILTLRTTVPTDPLAASGAPDSWVDLSVGVFQRRGAALRFGDTNYFMDSSDTAPVRFEHGRLTLHFAARMPDSLAVDLDLEQRDQAWVGRLHRGQFDSAVTLRRPGASLNVVAPVVGTWREHDSLVGSDLSCIHLAEQSPDGLTGWSDSIYVPGRVRFAPGVHPLATTPNVYGRLMKVQLQPDGNIQLELGAFSGVCCSRHFAGRLAENGQDLLGDWIAGPNQIQRQASWTKMPAGSCRSGAM